MLEFPAKGVLPSNKVCADVHFYENKPHKLRGKECLVNTYGRYISMFISDGMAYVPDKYGFISQGPPYSIWKV